MDYYPAKFMITQKILNIKTKQVKYRSIYHKQPPALAYGVSRAYRIDILRFPFFRSHGII